jgi:signal transduction histidine kinase
VKFSRGPADNGRRPSEDSPASEVLFALRALRTGGLDDAGRALELGPSVAGSLSAVLAALRWGAVLVGVAWAATGAASGDLSLIATLTIAIFLTSWRTIRPIRLGDPSQTQQALALSDVAILSAAIGLSDGLGNPFIGAVIVAVAVVAFGWGLRLGAWAAVTALVVSTCLASVIAVGISWPRPAGVMAVLGAWAFPGIAQQRLLQLEDRRRRTNDRASALSDTNQLLGALHQLAVSVPSSLDLPDILDATRHQLVDTLRADRFVVLAFDDSVWSPQLQEGFDLPPSFTSSQLPNPLIEAAAAPTVLRIDDLAGRGTGRIGAGIYARLVGNGRDTGLIAVERNAGDPFSAAEAELLDGFAQMLALTIANARSFQQLRSLAAADERSRIARDLHDRLGQWLTYIGIELERINTAAAEPSLELKQLHGDVQGAIADLRDTLIELRAAVQPGRPLSIVLAEVVDRFSKRSDIEVALRVPDDRAAHLAPIVENELLRIAQEALTNVEKHAKATHVHLGWSIENGRGVLVVQDNGRGFDPGRGIRGTAYGLVGMRERAASVGAILEVTSEPDQGTVITVLTSPPS